MNGKSFIINRAFHDCPKIFREIIGEISSHIDVGGLYLWACAEHLTRMCSAHTGNMFRARDAIGPTRSFHEV